MDYLAKNQKGMEYLKICYTKSNLDKIIDALIKKVAPELEVPDKITRVYFDTKECEGTDSTNCYQNLINQTRFYIKGKKILFITTEEVYIIPFSKIVAYDIVLPNENCKRIYSISTQITKTDTGNVVKRAIIGGVLGGGVGALIGGATAKTTTTESNPSKSIYEDMYNNQLMELHLKFDDIMSPVIKINFDANKDEINDVAESLDVIVRRNAENDESEDYTIIKESYRITEIGDSLGISATDPFSKYTNIDNTVNSGCFSLLGLILFITIGAIDMITIFIKM